MKRLFFRIVSISRKIPFKLFFAFFGVHNFKKYLMNDNTEQNKTNKFKYKYLFIKQFYIQNFVQFGINAMQHETRNINTVMNLKNVHLSVVFHEKIVAGFNLNYNYFRKKYILHSFFGLIFRVKRQCNNISSLSELRICIHKFTPAIMI